MSVQSISSAAEFASSLKDAKGKLVVVCFFSPQRESSVAALSLFASQSALAHTKDSSLFLQLDAEQAPEVAQAAGVTSLPSFAFFANAALVDLHVGGDPAALEAKVLSIAGRHAALKSGGGGGGAGALALLPDLSLQVPHYHNLEWRLDVQLGSRMLRSQIAPTLLVERETRDVQAPTADSEDPATAAAPAATAATASHKHLLQLDWANLDHLVQQLERAVKEVNTKHSRRVLRYVK